MEEEILECMKVGMDGVLVKPVDRQDLARRLQSVPARFRK